MDEEIVGQEDSGAWKGNVDIIAIWYHGTYGLVSRIGEECGGGGHLTGRKKIKTGAEWG